MKLFLYTRNNKYEAAIDKIRCRVCRVSVHDDYHFHQCSFKAKHFKDDIGLCTRHAKEEGWLDKDNLILKWVGRVDKYGSIKIGKIELLESVSIYTFRKGDGSLVDYFLILKKTEWEKYLYNSKEKAVLAITEQLKNRVNLAEKELKERKDQYSKWLEE